MRRFYAMLICMILGIQGFMLSGCAKQETESKAMGRYIEKDITLEALSSDEGKFAVQLKNGDVQAFVYSGNRGIECYALKEDLSFKKEESDWAKAFNEMIRKQPGIFIQAMAVDEKGNYYAACKGTVEGYQGELTPQNTHNYIAKLQEGKMQIIELKMEDGQVYVEPTHLCILENGDYILDTGYAGVMQFNASGEWIRNYGNTGNEKFVVDGGQILVTNSENHTIDSYDLISGELSKQMDFEEMTSDACLVFEGEDIYIAQRSGIYHLTKSGELCEQIMEGAGTTIGLPSRKIISVYRYKDTFITFIRDNEFRVSMKQYVYSATTPSFPDIELCAYMLEENSMLRESLVQYEMRHTDIRIEVEVGRCNENVTKEEALKALHTELIAGKGPDIILLDGLDIDMYKKEGVLASLDDIKEMDEMVPEVRKALNAGDGTYMLPMRFTVPCLVGDDEIVEKCSSLEDLVDYQKDNPTAHVLTYARPEAYFMSLAPMYLGKWDKQEMDETLNSIKFLLEGIKAFCEAYDDGEGMYYDIEDMEDIFRRGGIQALQVAFSDVKVAIWEITDIYDLLWASDLAKKNEEGGRLKILSYEGKGCFLPKCMVGVNKGTKHEKRVKEIISFMLSDENQMADTKEGFPTNQKTLERWLNGETINKQMHWQISAMDEVNYLEGYWGSIRELLPVFTEELKKMEVPVEYNYALMTLLRDDANDYFNNGKNIEEVLESMKSKLEIYRQEKGQ